MAFRRSEQMRMDREDAEKARRRNGPRKFRERLRREQRMIEHIKSSEFPYSPNVMSWLSVKLDKKASRITESDAKKLVT